MKEDTKGNLTSIIAGIALCWNYYRRKRIAKQSVEEKRNKIKEGKYNISSFYNPMIFC